MMKFEYKYLGSCEVDYDEDDLENILSVCTISHDYYWPQERLYEKFVDGDRIYKYSFQEAECKVLLDEESFDGNDHYHVEIDGDKIGTIPFKKTEQVGKWVEQEAVVNLHIVGGPYKDIKETPDGLLAYEMEKNDFSVRVSFSLKEAVPEEKIAKTIEPEQRVSSKNHTHILLAAIFLGFLGVHRFMAGKTGTGVLWLLTLGVFGVGWFVDVVHLLGNCFDDYSGAPIVSEKGKTRVAAQGYGAQHNAVPEAFCWGFIGFAVVQAALMIFIGVKNPDQFTRLSWFASYIGALGYPCLLAWLISAKGVNG